MTRWRTSSIWGVSVTDQLDRFERFCSLLTIEDGSPFRLEPWQREVVADLLAADEGLVLIAKGDGKTTLLAVYALFHLLTVPNAACYCAAASRDQASILYGQASGFVKRSPQLRDHLEVKAGYRRIRSLRDSGVLQVLSADADTADGLLPSLVLVDELHRHRDDSLYSVLRDGLGKRGGSMVTISTAGAVEDSALGQLRARALALPDVRREGAHTIARSADFVMHEWAVPADADVHDMAVVKQAHPSSFVTTEAVQRRHDSPSMRESVWRRLTCNQWCRTEAESWVGAEAWDACEDAKRDIPKGTVCVLALDGSYNGDCTAVVGCVVGEHPHLWVAGLWEPEDGSTVPVLEVEDRISELCRTLAVREIAADPYRWQRSLEVLSTERHLPVVVFPQSPSRMVPATSRLFDAISGGAVTHDGHEALRNHVLNAVVRDRGHGVQLAKESRKSRRKIDLAVAAVMAFERAAYYTAGPRTIVWGAAEAFGPPSERERERERREAERTIAAVASALGMTAEELVASE
jgi:phage terminase large subunit-like protein